jgi:hypothetical protein
VRERNATTTIAGDKGSDTAHGVYIHPSIDDAIATHAARIPRSNARDDTHDRFSCDIPPPPSRARASRATFANARIDRSLRDTRTSPTRAARGLQHAIDDDASSSRTLLARTATDRRRCVVVVVVRLTWVVTTGVARASADRMMVIRRCVATTRATPRAVPTVSRDDATIQGTCTVRANSAVRDVRGF